MLSRMFACFALTGLLTAVIPPAEVDGVGDSPAKADAAQAATEAAAGVFDRGHGHATLSGTRLRNALAVPAATPASSDARESAGFHVGTGPRPSTLHGAHSGSFASSAWSVQMEPPAGDPWAGGDEPNTGAGRPENSRPVTSDQPSYDAGPPSTAPSPTPQNVEQSAQSNGYDRGYTHESVPNDDTIVAAGRRRRGAGRDGRDTLFGDGDEGFGFHFDVSLKGTAVDRKAGLMMGTGFGAIIADRLELGLRWNWLVTPQFTEIGVRRLNFDFNYGGFHLGVFAVRRGFFRLMVGGVVGGGSACLDDERLDRCYAKASLFAGEPELTAIFSVLKFMRITLGGGYRFVQPQRWSGPTGSELGGPTGTFAIQLGAFDQVGRKGKIRW